MITYLRCLCNEIFYFFFNLSKRLHPGETKEEFVPRGFGLDEHHDKLE